MARAVGALDADLALGCRPGCGSLAALTDDVTRRWVAQAHSARGATVALFRYGLTRRLLWVTLAATWLVLAALLAVTFDETYGLVSRALGAVVYATLTTAAVLVVVVVLSALANWRMMRQRLVPGTTWEVTATDESMDMCGPLAVRVCLPYQGIATVRLVGDWVLMRQQGSPMTSVWPRELIPDEALARMSVGGGR